MNERIVDLLVYLMAELRSHEEFGRINMSSLAKKGYTDAEISTAFSWLFDRLDARRQRRGERDADRSVRFLHSVELAVLRPEGYGYLLQCCQLGLLAPDDVESVIERVMLSGAGEVGVDDIKRVIAAVLFETDRPEEGGYPHLGPADSIH